MIPAAFSALLNGDLENFEVATTPGGIDAQKARGQQVFCVDDTLPIKCEECQRSDLEALGIIFGEQVDDLFVKAQLPSGWRKEQTSDMLWSDLLDDKGRKRADILYKAAFYDRQAFIRLCSRYRADWEKGAAVDWDGSILWRSGPLRTEPDDSNKDEWLAWYQYRKNLMWQAQDWLDEHKPGWRDPMMYWD